MIILFNEQEYIVRYIAGFKIKLENRKCFTLRQACHNPAQVVRYHDEEGNTATQPVNAVEDTWLACQEKGRLTTLKVAGRAPAASYLLLNLDDKSQIIHTHQKPNNVLVSKFSLSSPSSQKGVQEIILLLPQSEDQVAKS